MDTDEAAAFHVQHQGAAFRHDSRHAEDVDKKRRQHLENTCLDGGATSAGARFPPAFAGLVPGDSRDGRKARLEAYAKCWGAMKAGFQEAMDRADLPALQRAAAHVAAQHAAAAGPVANGTAAGGALSAVEAAAGVNASAGAAAGADTSCIELPPPPPRWLPAAVVDAGGAPAADVARAVDTLAALLTAGDQGAYLARMNGADLGPDVAVADVLRRILLDWSGLDIADVTAQLLVQWHSDAISIAAQLPDAAATAQTAAAAAPEPAAAAEPHAADASATRCNGAVGNGADAAGQPRDATAEGADAAEHGAASPADGQRLRPRKRPKVEADAEAAAAAEATEKRRNARRPLVLLLQGAEAADPVTLGALISVLSEVHAQLPVTLVLMVRGALPLLLARLSRPAVRALRCRRFLLPPPQARLEAAVLGGMLGPAASGVFPGPALLGWLARRFTRQEASVAGLIRSLQVACMAHFRQAPLSAAAAALVIPSTAAGAIAAGGATAAVRAVLLAKPCEALLQDAKREGAFGLRPSDRLTKVAGDVADAVAAASLAWAGWAVAVRCLALAAEATGMHGERYSILRLATAAAAGEAFVDGPLFAEIAQAVRRMPEAHAEALAESWRDQPASVARGESAFSEQTAALQAISDAIAPPAAAAAEAAPAEFAAAQAAEAREAAAGPAAGAAPASPTGLAVPAEAAASAGAAPPPASPSSLMAPAAAAAAAAPAEAAADAADAGVTTPPAAVGGGSRKRTPGSRTSRRSLLVSASKGQHAEAVDRGTASQATTTAAAAATPALQSLSAQLARWLRDVAAVHLATPPFQLPGAAALCMDDVTALEASIAAAPRATVHAALTAPQRVLNDLQEAGSGGGGGGGIQRSHPDAAIAYQLMQNYGEVVSLGRAFVDFADVAAAAGATHEEGAEDVTEEEAEEAGPSNGRMSYAHRRKRRAGKRVTREQGPAADGGGTAARSTRQRKQSREAAEAEMRARVAALPQEQRLRLAARFQEAVLALQQAGLVAVRQTTRGTQLVRAAWQPTSGGGAADPRLEGLDDGWEGDEVDAGPDAVAAPEPALPSARAAAAADDAATSAGLRNGGDGGGEAAGSSDSEDDAVAAADGQGADSSEGEGAAAAGAAAGARGGGRGRGGGAAGSRGGGGGGGRGAASTGSGRGTGGGGGRGAGRRGGSGGRGGRRSGAGGSAGSSGRGATTSGGGGRKVTAEPAAAAAAAAAPAKRGPGCPRKDVAAATPQSKITKAQAAKGVAEKAKAATAKRSAEVVVAAATAPAKRPRAAAAVQRRRTSQSSGSAAGRGQKRKR